MSQADHVTTENAKVFTGKKKWVFIVIAAISLLVASSVLGYAFARQSLIDAFFPATAMEIPNDLVNHEEQIITIDDYTMTLKETLCEKSTGMGYFLISVAKKNSVPEAQLDGGGQLMGNSFGEGNRFAIGANITGGMTLDAKREGDLLYLYLQIQATRKEDVDNLEHSFVIMDQKYPDHTTGCGYREYYYKGAFENRARKTVTDAGQMITVSPVGIMISSKTKFTVSQLNLVMQDGTKKKLVEGKICYGVNRSDYAPDADDKSGEYICKISFRELIDYKQVIDVQMNQKTYSFS